MTVQESHTSMTKETDNMTQSPDAPDRARRMILKGAAFCGVAGLGLADLPLLLTQAQAADAKGWPAEAFKQKNEAAVLKALYGKTATPSDKINLDAPEIAENGAVVPIAIKSSLPKVTAMAVLVLHNPYTLAAAYKIPDGTEAMMANRLKMAKTSKVVAVVESDGKLYTASKEVKVTVGGCGG
jgi:sulfur-oxidizing protein SoxY